MSRSARAAIPSARRDRRPVEIAEMIETARDEAERIETVQRILAAELGAGFDPRQARRAAVFNAIAEKLERQMVGVRS